MREVIESGQPVIVERAGKPQVVVLSIAEYEDLLAGQGMREDWRVLLAQAHEQIRVDSAGRQLPPPEEMIHQMREERDAQLFDLR